MKLIYKSLFLTALSFLAIGCNDDLENNVNDIQVTSGEADFSNYVSLGNSLTSGYADGALYKSAQENSYPAIIANQMKLAGGGEFKQPLMPDDIGGILNFGLSGKLELKIVDGSPVPVAMQAQSNFEPISAQGPFNNMGVPGAKSFHLLASGYGNVAGIQQGLANPYFARFATSPTTTVLADAMAQKPTFFSLWIGNNDLLYYAMSGGVGVNQAGNMNPATYGSNDISAPEVIANVIETISKTMVENGAKGVLANLPEVTSIPFFTTVPAKPLSPANTAYASQIGTLNEFYSALNTIFDNIGASDRKIVFNENAGSGIIFVDDSLEDLTQQIATAFIRGGVPAPRAYAMGALFGQVRQSREGDLIPLTMASKIGTVDQARVQELIQMGLPQDYAIKLSLIGLTYAKDEYVLSADEVSQLATATKAVNESIRQIAMANNLALADMNSEMKKLQSGMMFNAVKYNTDYISGGAFSLDGVHSNSRGYAIVSNVFIRAINKKYNANLPQVNPNNYPGTLLP